jgi:hypothetical protein
MTNELSYAARFFMMALVEMGNPVKCVHLADPQMNVFLVEAFRNRENCERFMSEFLNYAGGGVEPNWHKQAREMIESR